MTPLNLSALKASMALASLSHKGLGLLCIALAEALTSAAVLDMAAKKLPLLTDEEKVTAASEFILLAFEYVTGVSIEEVKPREVPASEPTAEAKEVAEKEMQALIERLKKGATA